MGADLRYLSRQGTLVGKGCGLYWRYEKRVKELESAVNSLIGVSGCLYAVRARLYTPIEPDLTSDFTIALDTFAKGYLTVQARGSVVEEDTNEEPRREFDMRTRIIVQTIHALVRRARLLNPIRYGLFAFQLWSHKVLRYLVPELVAGALVASLVLALQDGPRAALYRAGSPPPSSEPASAARPPGGPRSVSAFGPGRCRPSCTSRRPTRPPSGASSPTCAGNATSRGQPRDDRRRSPHYPPRGEPRRG